MQIEVFLFVLLLFYAIWAHNADARGRRGAVVKDRQRSSAASPSLSSLRAAQSTQCPSVAIFRVCFFINASLHFLLASSSYWNGRIGTK